MTASSVSSKLKSLGVKVGARDVPAPRPPEERRRRHGVENVVAGRVVENALGACYVVENDYAADYQHGHTLLHAPLPLSAVARWARDPRIAGCARESLVFLDTETTGLAGGTGTLPFMIGVGRFTGRSFRVAQFFMRGPEDEPALLAALADWLEPCETLVTFNGRAFDVPLVATRYTLHRRKLPVKETPHLDLLPLARRLWRDRLPSRALGSLEQHILGATRHGEDVPGFMIPLMYFEYLRSGDARPLKGVFYHNAMDVLAMAALLGHIAQMMSDPVEQRSSTPSSTSRSASCTRNSVITQRLCGSTSGAGSRICPRTYSARRPRAWLLCTASAARTARRWSYGLRPRRAATWSRWSRWPSTTNTACGITARRRP